MSWKHSFKAHRVAANMGNLSDNYVYHREWQSFPQAMARPAPKQGRSRWLGLQTQLQKLRRNLLPGGNQGNVGIYFGAALPVLGSLVLYAFMASSTSEHNQAFKLTQKVLKPEPQAEGGGQV
mmetsp:Transcript_76351/g.247259  ORF Transcript_76351/g.247259 Transcript_76351/m.247259 type:complete len:122 (-) Transcript_76351:196-561(-)